MNVEGRYFVQDNLRLDANVGYANVDVDTVGDDDVMIYGVGAEYQLEQFPGLVQQGATAKLDSDSGNSDAWTLGVRYNWGGTLRDRDRSGASQASLTNIGVRVLRQTHLTQ